LGWYYATAVPGGRSSGGGPGYPFTASCYSGDTVYLSGVQLDASNAIVGAIFAPPFVVGTSGASITVTPLATGYSTMSLAVATSTSGTWPYVAYEVHGGPSPGDYWMLQQAYSQAITATSTPLFACPVGSSSFTVTAQSYISHPSLGMDIEQLYQTVFQGSSPGSISATLAGNVNLTQLPAAGDYRLNANFNAAPGYSWYGWISNSSVGKNWNIYAPIADASHPLNFRAPSSLPAACSSWGTVFSGGVNHDILIDARTYSPSTDPARPLQQNGALLLQFARHLVSYYY
jgi:hypothetical protein